MQTFTLAPIEPPTSHFKTNRIGTTDDEEICKWLEPSALGFDEWQSPFLGNPFSLETGNISTGLPHEVVTDFHFPPNATPSFQYQTNYVNVGQGMVYHSRHVQTSPVTAPTNSSTTTSPTTNVAPVNRVDNIPRATIVSKPKSPDMNDERKRKNNPNNRSFVRRVRQTRPKVVESKGAIQCKGRNRKKGTQCRNAALMEYIGPRPQFCAEHIELDPNSLYEKCKAGYQKERGDQKGCKEVVLKEFRLCYKHFGDLVTQLVEENDEEKLNFHMKRITELLIQLEREAAAAKKKDGDLYQRKNKLIPKFQEMKKIIAQGLKMVTVGSPKPAQTVFQFKEIPMEEELISETSSDVYSDEDPHNSPQFALEPFEIFEEGKFFNVLY